MSTKLPGVAGGVLWGAGASNGFLVLDTGAWFSWLEATTTSFSYPVSDPADGFLVGYMTVRPRGGTWWAWYRHGRRLQKRYLGPSRDVTQAHLEEVARAFLRPAVHHDAGVTATPAQ